MQQPTDGQIEASFLAVVSRHGSAGISMRELFLRASRVAGVPMSEERIDALLRTMGSDPDSIVMPGAAFPGGRPAVLGADAAIPCESEPSQLCR
jgi:hypothetical protein